MLLASSMTFFSDERVMREPRRDLLLHKSLNSLIRLSHELERRKEIKAKGKEEKSEVSSSSKERWKEGARRAHIDGVLLLVYARAGFESGSTSMLDLGSCLSSERDGEGEDLFEVECGGGHGR